MAQSNYCTGRNIFNYLTEILLYFRFLRKCEIVLIRPEATYKSRIKSRPKHLTLFIVNQREACESNALVLTNLRIAAVSKPPLMEHDNKYIRSLRKSCKTSREYPSSWATSIRCAIHKIVSSLCSLTSPCNSGTTYSAESHYAGKNFANLRERRFRANDVIKGMKCTESNYANENL